MRVPGIVFASRSSLPDEHGDMALASGRRRGDAAGNHPGGLCDADLPWGKRVRSAAWGRRRRGRRGRGEGGGGGGGGRGVVSPGGVGFDISCGVRLLVSRARRGRLRPRYRAVMDRIGAGIPVAWAPAGLWRLPARSVRWKTV